MLIRARMSMSADDHVTTPSGWPALVAERPAGTPGHVVTDIGPARLLAKLRAANHSGDVHLVGGPQTRETFRSLGALDVLEPAESGLDGGRRSSSQGAGLRVLLPVRFGAGMRPTESFSPDAGLTFERERALPGGPGEIVYSSSGRA